MRRMAAIVEHQALDGTLQAALDRVELRQRAVLILAALDQQHRLYDVADQILDRPGAELRLQPDIGPAEERIVHAAGANSHEFVRSPWLPKLIRDAGREPVERDTLYRRGIRNGTRWLAQSSLVRTLTAVVDNVANGETPRPHLEFLAPKQRFKAARRPQRQIVPDAAGFAGYEPFADVFASLDAGATATAYRTLAPLFEAAYVDLGHPGGGFPKALERALQALAAVPVLREDVALVPHAIGFRYQDPALEALTPAQKQFLRIGPRNVRIVQGKLRELQAALAP